MKCKLSKYKQDSLIRDYLSGIRVPELEKKYNVSPSSILRLRKRLNIKALKPHQREMSPPKHDLTGQSFGRIKVVEMFCKKRRWRAKCECKCGQTDLNMSPYDLRKGNIKSCGCARNETRRYGKDNPAFTGYREISGQRWSQIRISAQNRGITFDITIKNVWKIYLKQKKKCAITGQSIIFGKASHDRYTASLDRIDSNGGYEKGNVQWVHKDINLMKRSFSQEYFLKICLMTVQHLLPEMSLEALP